MMRTALRDFIAGIPAFSGADGLEAASVERGRQLFDDLGCGSWHAAPRFSDDAARAVDTPPDAAIDDLVSYLRSL